MTVTRLVLKATSVSDAHLRMGAVKDYLREQNPVTLSLEIESLCVETAKGIGRSVEAMRTVARLLTSGEVDHVVFSIQNEARKAKLFFVPKLLAPWQTADEIHSQPWLLTGDFPELFGVGEPQRSGDETGDADGDEMNERDIEPSVPLEYTRIVSAALHAVQGDDNNAQDPRIPDYGTGRQLTLGERKALARRPNRKQIGTLVRDPHPAVIRNLLANPVLTEEDVVRMAAKRPALTEVLHEIAQHQRWADRARVLRALVLNPKTSIQIAVTRAFLLPRQDLAFVASVFGTQSEVRDVVDHLLAARK